MPVHAAEDRLSDRAWQPDGSHSQGGYFGQRMTADEFLSIQDETTNYELIDGVVVVSPSPEPPHQKVTLEVAGQLWVFNRHARVGELYVETDVHFGEGRHGGDVVYRPEIIFVRNERVKDIVRRHKIQGAPHLVVEVISRGSRHFDTTTKKSDYERFGIHELWLFDPERKGMMFYRSHDGRLVEVPAAGNTFASEAVPGFLLDLVPIRELMEQS